MKVLPPLFLWGAGGRAGQEGHTCGHVAYVEQTHVFPNGLMFLDDPGLVLYRQQIPREGDNFPAVLHMRNTPQP